MAYYKDLDSYTNTAESTRVLQIRVILNDGDTIYSSAIPYSTAVQREIEEDLALFYQGDSLAIWNKDKGILYHVHLRDVRKIELAFIS